MNQPELEITVLVNTPRFEQYELEHVIPDKVKLSTTTVKPNQLG